MNTGVIVFLLIFVLLIFIGVYASARLYKQGALTTGHIKRILRYRTIKPPVGVPVIEEIVEEEIDEEGPFVGEP